MEIRAFVAVAALGVALSGCASVIEGSTQVIALTTPPVRGATCFLSNPQGRWRVTTPAHVKVKRSKEDIAVHCKKEGYRDARATIPSEIEPWTASNLLNAGVGLGVDAWTGAINAYPDDFKVPMKAENGYSSSPWNSSSPWDSSSPWNGSSSLNNQSNPNPNYNSAPANPDNSGIVNDENDQSDQSGNE